MSAISESLHQLLAWIPLEKPDTDVAIALAIVRGFGHPLRIPILKEQRFVAAGTRPLPVGWTGGNPPFSVTLRGPDGKILTKQADLKDSRSLLPPVTLSPGYWTLEVADAGGHVATGRLAVVDAASVPVLNDPSLASLPPDAAHTVTAAWLASQSDGGWAFEAAIEAAAAGEQFEPAKMLTEKLLRGQVPKPDGG